MSKIDLNQGDIEGHSSNIDSAASMIELNNLSAVDNVTTIAGNELSKKAYADAQNVIRQLQIVMNNEAKKIRNLGEEFKSVDEQLSSIVRNMSDVKA